MKKTVLLNLALVLVTAALGPTAITFGSEGVPPIANAGLSRYAAQDPVVLDGTDSYDPDNSLDMANFTRSSHVCRMDDVNNYLRWVAVQFDEPLPFKPGEQSDSESGAQQTLESAPA